MEKNGVWTDHDSRDSWCLMPGLPDIKSHLCKVRVFPLHIIPHNSFTDRSAESLVTVQLGLQFHMGVIMTNCLTTGFWNRETISSFRSVEVVNVILLIPIKTIWTWIPNVFSFFIVLDMSTEDDN